MGLKNKLNKMKSFLFDEVDEKENKSSKTKEKKVVKRDFEEEKEVRKKEEDVEELYFDDTNIDLKTDDIVKSRVTKNEREFKFPEFDDDDFIPVQKQEKPKEKPVIEEKPKPIPLYQGSKRKEESKRFKPSPIISPIYGLLDEEGNSVKKDSDSSLARNNDEVTYDDVRRKAYGIIEKELSDTIKNLNSKTIEEAEKEMEEKEKKLAEKKSKHKKVNAEEDDMILPDVDFKEIDIDKEVSIKTTKKIPEEEDDDEETKEQDLFKLIDTMYDEEGKE